MPTIFIEPTNPSEWTTEQKQTSEAIWPVLKAYLTREMRNQEACDRFYDAYQAATRARNIVPSEFQKVVRIPVVESLGHKFKGPDAGLKYSVVYYLLGAPTCLNWNFPSARLDSPATMKGIEKTTRDLVECLVTLGIDQKMLDDLLELIKPK
jgi:hypothetical protein